MAEPTNEQRKAIGAFVRGTLSPLIEEVLTKKLSQAAAYVAEELSAEAALAHSVSDEQIDAVWDALPGGRDAFLTQWGYRTFARAILDLVAPDGVTAVDHTQLLDDLRVLVSEGLLSINQFRTIRNALAPGVKRCDGGQQ